MKALVFSLLLGAAWCAGADNSAGPAVPQGSLYALDSTWTKQTGEKIEWRKSSGTTRVVALGYATCKGVCPRIIGDMQRIEQALDETSRAGCRFTFVSLDPVHDKVPELKALAERHKLDAAHWDLLTGSEDSVLELAVALGVRYDRLPNGIDFAHSYLIAVIGPDGTLVHQWTDSAQGPRPAVLAVKRALGQDA